MPLQTIERWQIQGKKIILRYVREEKVFLSVSQNGIALFEAMTVFVLEISRHYEVHAKISSIYSQNLLFAWIASSIIPLKN